MDLELKGKKIKYYTLDGINGVGRVLDEDEYALKVSNVLDAAVDDNFSLIFKRALVRIEFLKDIGGPGGPPPLG